MLFSKVCRTNSPISALYRLGAHIGQNHVDLANLDLRLSMPLIFKKVLNMFDSLRPASLAIKSIAACILISSVTGLFAQPVEIMREPVQNVAQLSTSGSIEVQPDLLLIAMNTTASGADANAVQSQLKLALDAALAIARPAVLSGQLELRTGNFSLYPRYDKNGKINGWQGSTELILDGRDFSRITATAGKIQSLTIGNVSFSLSREQRTKVEAEAQTNAIERFKAKALGVAKSFGFSGYTLREVSISANDQNIQPRPRFMAMQAKANESDSPMSIEVGKTTVTVSINGFVQMR